MKSKLRVEIASPPDREHVVAQIMLGSEQWAEVNHENESFELEVYCRHDGSPFAVDCDDATAAIASARERLLGRR
jgi:hypothetical protein